MLRRTLFSLLLFAVLLSFGCATGQNITPILQGMTYLNQAEQAFGPPDTFLVLPDGRINYIWEIDESYYTPPMVVPVLAPAFYGGYWPRPYYGRGYGRGYYRGPYVGMGMTAAVTPGSTSYYMCTLKLLVDPDGRIVARSYTGNACDRLLLDSEAPLVPPVPTVVVENAPVLQTAPDKQTKGKKTTGRSATGAAKKETAPTPVAAPTAVTTPSSVAAPTPAVAPTPATTPSPAP